MRAPRPEALSSESVSQAHSPRFEGTVSPWLQQPELLQGHPLRTAP